MRKALGKGIDALITRIQENEIDTQEVQKIPVNRIQPNKYQPRKIFKEDSMRELSKSIQKHGLTQPIILSKPAGGENYEIIAGERRWRACKMAGMKTIDAIVKTGIDEGKKLALSLIENLQREDLNAIDEALGYQKLMEEFHITQSELAEYCGKSKSAVSNTLRLLDLEDEIKKALQSGAITEGHGRALISIPDKEKRRRAFEFILAEKWSVREIENYSKNFYSGKSLKQSVGKRTHKSPEIVDAESRLQSRIGTKVEIHQGSSAQSGKIVIYYYSLDDFDRIVRKMES
ncbi:MAG: ParB/RepB/Spo0J family partition protein [Elusimicrobia bacterium]|nr:ParB/RepB/Spo0J family partition protein [Elusimicrobiota bacterium]